MPTLSLLRQDVKMSAVTVDRMLFVRMKLCQSRIVTIRLPLLMSVEFTYSHLHFQIIISIV
jgi:hypothetical protein